jgi:hypothetical protein
MRASMMGKLKLIVGVTLLSLVRSLQRRASYCTAIRRCPEVRKRWNIRETTGDEEYNQHGERCNFVPSPPVSSEREHQINFQTSSLWCRSRHVLGLRKTPMLRPRGLSSWRLAGYT